jgi:predicted N-acyltransferase
LANSLSFKIYASVISLPENWDQIADRNIFLTSAYLEVLEKSAPNNMTCYFIGIFDAEKLEGIAIAQFLNLNKLDSFGNRDKCLKTMLRNFTFRNFASHVLFIGNNMLTGQNAFIFSNKVNKKQALSILKCAATELHSVFKNKSKKIHITTYKDFDSDEIEAFGSDFKSAYRFSTQPNMILNIDSLWESEQDYVGAFSKKYRDQYKRARKKALGVGKKKMTLDDIINNEDRIYDLYMHVARHAPFNSFYLAKNHFRTLKQHLKDDFCFYGYFIDDKLIGFSTLIKNGTTMETYFLGYDENAQREKMLYLNMLYDMIAYSVNNGFKEIIFARTALEIKSSVGAQPLKMFGLIEHSNSFVNRFMGSIFDYLEPKTAWQQRHPFRLTE